MHIWRVMNKVSKMCEEVETFDGKSMQYCIHDPTLAPEYADILESSHSTGEN